ncbi:MAG: DNA gyrase inhibitor YacG [Candidatus Rokuibacteriota bacterium]|nr:MAG: DNA gyrase inhibitor YacG [Candidatus Rokubacteria bacterium]TMH13689.1 MAG: DNA gyrase inhibitor YacG [Betaproteobacteria bacterium]
MSRPICAASTPWQRNPHRLFCSLTCRLVDLGVWLDEGYRVADDERGDVP